jgi:hypothetical protein
MDTKVKTHTFVPNPSLNGGEQILLNTDIYLNSEGKAYLNQSWHLYSYTNSVELNISGSILTPEILRRLADELETAIKTAEDSFSSRIK